MRHCRPVPQRRNEQHGIVPAAANQLLHGLRAIEEPGGGFRDHGQTVPMIGHDCITLIVHRRIEGQVAARKLCLRLRGLHPLQPNEGSIVEHNSLSEALLCKVLGSKPVLHILFSGDKEPDAPNRNRLHGKALARRGYQVQIVASRRRGRLSKRAGCDAHHEQRSNGGKDAHGFPRRR